MKKIKFFVFVIIILILLVLFLFFKLNIFKSTTDISSTNSLTPEIVENSKLENKTFTLTAIGDVLCHNTQYWDAHNKTTDEYDFSYVFDDVKTYTSAGDITLASLETSFAGNDVGYSNYPTFNSPDSLATALKGIGVDIISTAGNHALDMGFKGLCRTIDVLDNNEI